MKKKNKIFYGNSANLRSIKSCFLGFFERFQRACSDTLQQKGLQFLEPFIEKIIYGCDAKINKHLFKKWHVVNIPDDHHWAAVYEPYFNRIIEHKNKVFSAGVSIILAIELHHPNKLFLEQALIGHTKETFYEKFLKRLVFHDLSKFSAVESIGYANYFTPKGKDEYFRQAFEDAKWNHFRENSHHPEHWFLCNKEGDKPTALEMPFIYIAEWVADLKGAESYGQSVEKFLADSKFHLHTQTKVFANHLLNLLQINYNFV